VAHVLSKLIDEMRLVDGGRDVLFRASRGAFRRHRLPAAADFGLSETFELRRLALRIVAA
jgi:hypothetical protein